jgi:Tol biopolymer transport system component
VIAFGATGDAGASALYLVQSDGTGAQKLTDEVQPVSFPRWSPDGARIAYVTGGGRGAGTEAALRVYDFDGAQTSTVSEHVLASGDEAPMAWSPDGKRIAFIDATDGGTLRLYDIDKQKLLDSPAVRAAAVDWSAKDQLAIVAPAGDPSTTGVYTLKPSDNKAHLRLQLDGIESEPAWSLDGEALAFWNGPSVELTQRTLLVLPDGAKSAKELGPGVDPAWSNDGRLAYSRPETPGTRGALDIYVSDSDGGALTRVTQSITLDRWPSWSPASDAVAYLAQADASTTFVCVTALATLDNTCFDLPGLTPGAPAWSPY